MVRDRHLPRRARANCCPGRRRGTPARSVLYGTPRRWDALPSTLMGGHEEDATVVEVVGTAHCELPARPVRLSVAHCTGCGHAHGLGSCGHAMPLPQAVP